MNDLLQQHISQHFAPEVSVESYDPLEMLSFESAMREDIGQLGRSIAMATAIEGLDEVALSNEAYQVAIESIFTTAEVEIPLSAVVPSFESSQALVVASGTDAEAKVSKKKGILKRIWAFIKGLWAKLKAKFATWFGKKKQHVEHLKLGQSKMEAAAQAVGYKFGGTEVGADKSPVGIGYQAGKVLRIGVLGKNPADVAKGADAVAGASLKLTHAAEQAFEKLLHLDFTKFEGDSISSIAKSVGDHKENVTLPSGGHATFFIGRSGAQVIVEGGGHESYDVKDPSQVPVRELLHARAAMVNALDVNVKTMEKRQGELKMLEQIADAEDKKIDKYTPEQAAELAASSKMANALQVGIGIASRLLACPVERILDPGIHEVDTCLGARGV
ncbi:hypothetical protein D3C85_149630 [compost metagenome]